jgi:isoquinoline 1-oxidoreductase beta subunit
MSTAKFSRRNFLKGAAVTGLHLFVAIPLVDVQETIEVITGPFPALDPHDALAEQPIALNAWIKIDPDETVTLTVSKSEMGQGVRTSLAMLIAEELEVDWAKVKVEQAPASSLYGRQMTVGSTSIRQLWTPLRTAGATAREMLIAAAAQTWNVSPESCLAENGIVRDRASGKQLPYGQLVAAAAQLPAPKNVKLKPVSDFKLIGKPTPRVDNPLVVSGKAIYGLDVRIPNMMYAVVARCPVFGGEVASYDDSAAKGVPGVKHVIQISRGIAVVAENTWAALKGREALKVTWNEGANVSFSTTTARAQLQQAVSQSQNMPDNVTKTLTATFDSPYLAHATMEPMNCVADVRADRCELWVPTQSPESARYAATNILGLPTDAVTVNVTLLGGGFGRRSQTDFVIEAVETSKAVNAPVKLMWSRDDDMHHDFYRPASHHVLQGGLDSKGQIVVVKHQVVGSEGGGPSPRNGGQASSLPYNFPTQVEGTGVRLPTPTGFWRAVYASQNVFATESFFDELAFAAGKDPFELRRTLARSPRLRNVIEIAADKAGWVKPLPTGSGQRAGRGIAAVEHLGSFIAQVVELTVADSGAIRVHRVVCAVDCGVPINPSTIEAQVQGATVDGLSMALKAEITIADGRVQQNSFRDYEWIRMSDMPVIEVHIVPSKESPGGLGELANPGVPPAIANAIFAATGKRIRSLPIRVEDVLKTVATQ